MSRSRSRRFRGSTLGPMDRRWENVHVIRWQSRGVRRASPQASVWTLFLIFCAVAGLAMLGAEATGWLHWTSPLKFAPVALVVLSVNGQLLSAGRAALAWIVG